MGITLEELTEENWRECARLSVADDQKHFVAPNAWSIAESKFNSNLYPYAVYNSEGAMVGFVMYEIEPEGDWWVHRLMSDHRYQGHGYGKAVMLELIQRFMEDRERQTMLISYEPENEVARKLYANVGFEETGEILEGEVVARLTKGRSGEEGMDER